MSILGVLRTERTPGRGDATYSTWRLKDANPNTPLTRAGRVNADRFWERITYFLDRMIPVANEYKIRMACHPHDPGVPPEGYQGVDRVLGTVDGLKKLRLHSREPLSRPELLPGTVSEMLQDPGKEIYDVIRYFGSRKKIFNVHFRNIRGHRDDFQEVYPDEGDIDFVKAIQVYQRSRISIHADAGPRAAGARRPRRPAVVRFLLRLHPGTVAVARAHDMMEECGSRC